MTHENIKHESCLIDANKKHCCIREIVEFICNISIEHYMHILNIIIIFLPYIYQNIYFYGKKERYHVKEDKCIYI